MTIQQQFIRNVKLMVFTSPSNSIPDFDNYASAAPQGIDLSQMHFKFAVRAADVGSPNNCAIRVYNLADQTVQALIGLAGGVEYTRVQLLGGYENGQTGIIFNGTIKQFRSGHESQTDSYLDILAADTDTGYNFGVCNTSLAAGSTPQQRAQAAVDAMGAVSAQQVKLGNTDFTGGILPRGRVLFGMARDVHECIADSQNATWSAQNGQVNYTPLQGYLPTEIVVLNSLTGLIGFPEQTDQGIRIRALLNPNFAVGGRVQLDNATVNQTISQKKNVANIAFDQWTGIQYLAKVSNDGTYRIYVVDHTGDTRGQEYYSDLTCLSMASPTGIVLAKQ